MAGEKILVVDDESEISELIRLYLLREGYQVSIVEDGRDVLNQVRVFRPHLIILDILLPGMDGFEICRELRKHTEVPILFLSCKGEETDKILGLGVGGDDYVTKPFSPGELVARVKAHLRRNRIRSADVIHNDCLVFPGLEIDLNSHIVRVDHRPVILSAKEFQLLAILAQNPNRVFSIDRLFSTVWNAQSLGDTRTVMVHISNLRKKIESDPSRPRYILTVRGVGYKFHSPPVNPL